MKVPIINLIVICMLCFPSFGKSQVVNSINKKDRQLERLARSYEKNGKYNEAFLLYQRLWNKNKNNFTYYRGIKNNLLKLKKYSEAIAVVEQMLILKKDFVIEADLGDVYYQSDNHEKAFNIWESIISKNNKDPGAYQAVANSMIANRLIDEAIEIYKKGRKNISKKNIFIIELANLYYAKIDYKNATIMYLDYLKYNQKKLSYVEIQLGRLAKSIEDVDLIINIIKKRIKDESRDLMLHKLSASLYLQFSKYEMAFKEYKYIDENEVHDSKYKKEKWGKELFRFAEIASGDGAYKYAGKAFELIINRYPQSQYTPKAMLGLADVYSQQNQFDLAIQVYDEIITKYPKQLFALNAYFRLGEIRLYEFNDPVSARNIFISITEQFSFNDMYFETMFKLGQCETRLNNLEKSSNWYLQIFNSGQATDEIKSEAMYKLAQIKFWQGSFDNVLKMLEKISEVPLVRNDQRGFFVNDALEFQLFIQENKKEIENLKTYAHNQLLIEQLKYEEALNNLINFVKSNPQSSLADETWIQIGKLQNLLKNYNLAIDAYRALMQEYPGSLNCDIAQMQIGEIYETGLGDVSQAIQAYESLLINYPESLLVEEVRKKIRKLEKSSVR